MDNVGFAPLPAPWASKPETGEWDKLVPFLSPDKGEERHRRQNCCQNRKHMHLARKRAAATDGRSPPAEGTGQ